MQAAPRWGGGRGRGRGRGKGLTLAHTGGQDQLAEGAGKALGQTQGLAGAAKRAAQGLGAEDRGAQELLLVSTRDVVVAQQHLLQASMLAAGHPGSHPAMGALREQAKAMVGAVLALTRTIKSVEDEAARGLRATEGAMQAIEGELKALDSDQPSKRPGATAAHLSAATRGVTMASARLVGAGTGTQAEVVTSANGLRKAVVDLLQVGKGAAEAAQDEQAKAEATKALAHTAKASLKLLAALHLVLQNPADMQAKKVRAQSPCSCCPACPLSHLPLALCRTSRGTA